MLSEPILVVPYNPAWKDEFIHYGRAIRSILGNRAARIDHIGSQL